MPRSSRSSNRNDKGPSQRQLRVGEELRHVLSEILSRGHLRDPMLAGKSITVTEVTIGPDLRHATVFCMPLGGKDAAAVVEALNKHKAFLRGELGHALTLRYTPSLQFAVDTSFDRGAQMDALLRRAVKDDHDDGAGGGA